METSLKTFERLIQPSTANPIQPNRAIHPGSSLGNLADYIPQMVWVVTPQGQGEYFNPFWGSYTGLSEEESFGFGWSQAFYSDDLHRLLELLRSSAASGGWQFEGRLRRAGDGSYRRHLCHCSVLPREANGDLNLLICCTDVEDLRRAEAGMKEQGVLLALTARTHDQEKRKIAHGLHDSAGQYLVALQMKLHGLQRCSIGNTGRKNPLVDECHELLKRCSRELRTTSYLLYPPLLDDLGLASAVRLHVDGFMERTSVKVDLDIEPNLGRLDRDLEIVLFRVVQEALASMQRQSAAGDAHVKIGANSTSVFVEARGVAGVEWVPEKFMPSSQLPSGFAVATLRQRILEAGGLFEMEPLPRGMVMRVAVPRKALVEHPCD